MSTLVSTPEQGAAGNPFGNAVKVLFSPSQTFRSIAVRPTWWAPIVIVAILSCLITYTYGRRAGWETFMRKQIESSPRAAQLPAEQKERIVQQQAKYAPIFGYVFSIGGPLVAMLVVGGVLLLVFNFGMAAGLTAKQYFAAAAYGWMPEVIKGLLAFPVMFLKEPDMLDIQNLVATNLAAVMDAETTSKWLIRLGTSMDLFNVWNIALISIGIFTMTKGKISFGKALAGVLGLFLVWVLLATGWAAIFS